MNTRLIFSLLIIALLAGGIGWAEYTSWKEVVELEEQLRSPALGRLLAQSENWPPEDRAALQNLVAEARTSLGTFRGWLIASCLGLLALVLVLARTIKRQMIEPLEHRLLESHAVIARQEKLAALGVLAAGVAHEIRNPLTTIKARIYSQTKRLTPDSLEHKDAQFIKAEIDRLERIVKDILQFARPGEPRLEPVPTAAFLQSIQEEMAPELKLSNIALRLEASENLTANIDVAQIKQVLINLIRNAAESMVDNGTITLRARAKFLPFAPRRASAVALEVEDTGPGIPSHVQARIFDPFFTTKESGTGLGLAIAERIVQRHGGVLEFRTQMQRGTTFSVTLPAFRPDESRR
jgi:signal transduction histidine kinase